MKIYEILESEPRHALKPIRPKKTSKSIKTTKPIAPPTPEKAKITSLKKTITRDRDHLKHERNVQKWNKQQQKAAKIGSL